MRNVQAARKNGFSNINELDIIILETTGDITIIKNLEEPSETVKDVQGYQRSG